MLGGDLAHVRNLGLQRGGAASQLLDRLLLGRERSLRCLGRLLRGRFRLRNALAKSLSCKPEDPCKVRSSGVLLVIDS